jgi:hypothetical protein
MGIFSIPTQNNAGPLKTTHNNEKLGILVCINGWLGCDWGGGESFPTQKSYFAFDVPQAQQHAGLGTWEQRLTPIFLRTLDVVSPLDLMLAEYCTSYKCYNLYAINFQNVTILQIFFLMNS